MKLLFLSDIHLGKNSNIIGRSLLQPLLSYLKEEKPDILIIAGDISDYYKTSLNVLNAIQEIGIKVLFIPGNHDIWVGSNETSWKAYENFKNHPSSLIDKPYIVNDEYVIIGDMGWYDYSFGPNYMDESQFNEQKKRLAKDHMYAKWEMSDKEVLQYMLEKMEVQLNKHKDKKVIFINHFIPFDEFVIFVDTDDDDDNDWNIGNAYMGSHKIGELIYKYKNIEWVVFGHTHHKFGTKYDFNGHNVICNPMGYVDEWSTNTFEEEIKVSSTILNI